MFAGVRGLDFFIGSYGVFFPFRRPSVPTPALSSGSPSSFATCLGGELAFVFSKINP